MAMTLTNSRATIGLQTRLTPTNTGVSGQISIGASNENLFFPDSDVIYSLQAFFPSSGDFDLDLATGIATNPYTWVAGTAQVETATAAGTASSSGDVTITITATGMTGSPKAIAVPITSGDTASVWAGKVRTALAADADVSALFSVSGDTTSIVLTRKPIETLNGSNFDVPVYASNDSSLNIEISAGTTGVTSTATSTNTTSGVATSGVLVLDGNGVDVEGNDISGIGDFDAILFKAVGGSYVDVTNSADFILSFYSNGMFLATNQSIGTSTITINMSGSGIVQITCLGTSA